MGTDTRRPDLWRTVPPQRLVDAVGPMVRRVLRSPAHALLDRGVLLLHVTGRRSGHRYDIPVGYLRRDDTLLVVTQHRWRVNLRGGADVEVTWRGRLEPMRATLEESPPRVAELCLELAGEVGWPRVGRWLGVRTPSRRQPSRTTLVAGVADLGLSVVTLAPRGDSSPR